MIFNNSFYTILTFLLLINTTFASTSKMRFIENKGQWSDNIFFNTKLDFGNIYFEKNNFTFVLVEKEHHSHTEREVKHSKKGHHFKINFENANTNVHYTYSGKSEHYFNYFLGNDKSKWANNVHEYENITYRNLYNGIDMSVSGIGENMKYEYYISPHSDPNQIKVNYEGVENLYLKNGQLHYATSVLNIIESAPYAFQIIEGKETEIVCFYKLNKATKSVQFVFPKGYDKNYELVIDPTLVFSRLSNATSDNFGFTATYDSDGRTYAGGIVFGMSGTYPTTIGAFDVSYNGGSDSPNSASDESIDIGISCYHATTGTLIYGTYVGGSSNEIPNSMVVNNAGELVVLGTTSSANFPINGTPPFDDSFNGGITINFELNGVFFPQGSDIVVFKLSQNGSAMSASTFIGGTENDGFNDDLNSQSEYNGTDLHFNYGDGFRGEIIVDNNDNVYVASSTNSINFPTAGTISNLQGEQDAIVFKLNSTLSNLLFSRYLGGADDDAAYSMKIDGNNNLFVDGGTKSIDFPTIGNPLNNTFRGGEADGYVAKLNNNNGDILASTYIGTDSYDQVYFVDLDESNNVYIVGQTLGNYPVQFTAFGNNNGKQFIHKLNNNLSTTIYSTVFGTGSNRVDISPTALLVDVCERVYVSGWGGRVNGNRNPNSTNNSIAGMPVSANALKSNTDGSDFYFFVLDKNASGLLYGTYFGGSSTEHVDGGTSRFDENGIIYQAICAACANQTFQTSASFNPNSSSPNCNVGVLKLNIDLPTTLVNIDAFPRTSGCVPLTVNFESIFNDVTNFEWDLGDGNISNQQNPVHTYTDTGIYTVRLIGSDPNSCNEIDTALITVSVSNDTLITDEIDTFFVNCNTLEVHVGAPFHPTTTYNWDMGDGTFYNDAFNFINHQYAQSGFYKVILHVIDTTKCEANGYDTIYLDFPPFVEADIGTNTGCINTPLSMQNFSNPNAETFIWDFGNGETSTEYEPATIYPNGGDYTVFLTVIDSGTCNIIAHDTNTISIIPPPIAKFTTDSNYYIYPDLVQFTNFSHNYDNFEWNFGDGEIDSMNIDPFHFYASIYDFKPCLTVWNNGCSDTVCKDIFIDFIPLIDIPNAFSPNNDGINDIIKVEGLGITQLSFRIYNRWGKLVYESFNQEEGWDGNYLGVLQEMEVYTYVVSATLLDGSTPILKGNITLIR